MTHTKSQPNPDMPVFSENRANAATQKAQRAIHTMWDELGTLRAVSAKIGVSSGYLSLVLNNKRPASKELLIALGLKKPRRVMSEAEREANKESRRITHALWGLYTAAHAGYKVSLTCNTDTGVWTIEHEHVAIAAMQVVDPSFTDAVTRIKAMRFARYTNDKNKS